MEKLKEYQNNPESFNAGMEYQNRWDEERIIRHLGHDVEVTAYPGAFSLTIECQDCDEVIWDNGI